MDVSKFRMWLNYLGHFFVWLHIDVYSQCFSLSFCNVLFFCLLLPSIPHLRFSFSLIMMDEQISSLIYLEPLFPTCTFLYLLAWKVHALGRMICNNILCCTGVGFDVDNINAGLCFSFSSVDHLHYWTSGL